MSKGLEALELLKNRALSDLDSVPKTAMSICEKSNEEVMKAYEILKQGLLKAQEQEKENFKLKKALEILKKTKNIEVYWFDNGKRHYRIKFDKTREQEISQEAFNLLNEVFGNEN